MQMGDTNLVQAIPRAVDEVGGPTILATFTVIAALLPMAFVTGLMGPYMSPIPINASMGMLISLAVALVLTPWMALKLLPAGQHEGHSGTATDGTLIRVFKRMLQPFLNGNKGKGFFQEIIFLVSLLYFIVYIGNNFDNMLAAPGNPLHGNR